MSNEVLFQRSLTGKYLAYSVKEGVILRNIMDGRMEIELTRWITIIWMADLSSLLSFLPLALSTFCPFCLFPAFFYFCLLCVCALSLITTVCPTQFVSQLCNIIHNQTCLFNYTHNTKLFTTFDQFVIQYKAEKSKDKTDKRQKGQKKE